MGAVKSGFARGDAFWSVRCRGGRAFAVQENPDGSIMVLAGSLLKDMHRGECSKKLAD